MAYLIPSLRAAAVALCVYWISIFVGTHLPGSETPRMWFLHSDKVLHFGAYLGLAMLCSLVCFRRQQAAISQRTLLVFTLACYAAFDELSQIAVPRRTCDWRDWVADLAGVLAGMALFFFLRRLAGFAPQAASDSPATCAATFEAA